MEEVFGLNIVAFLVSDKGRRRKFVIENGLICQLPPEERIFLVQAVEESWKPSSEPMKVELKKCFDESSLEAFLREGEKAAEATVGPAERGFTWKFLRSEMNRLLFGGLVGIGFQHDISNKKSSFLGYLYRELLPKEGVLEIEGIYAVPASKTNKDGKIRIHEPSLKKLEDMMNLLISKKELFLP